MSENNDNKKSEPKTYYAVREVIPDSRPHSVNDDAEIGASMYSSMSLPIIRKTSPQLMADNIIGVEPIRCEDLSPKEKKRWDEQERMRKHRDENTIELNIELAPYGSHKQSGGILDQDGYERYMYWEWLRNRVDIDDVSQYYVPEGKWEFNNHTIPINTKRFESFIEQYEDGDEIWLYENNGFR